jgi:tetratricopeptide (TPR) repeat protein
MEDINDQKLVKLKKRPLSVIFLAIYSSAYIIALLITLTGVIDFIDFLYGFLIISSFFGIPLFIVSIILLFINFRHNKRRTRGFGISAAICLLIVPLAFLSLSFFKDGLTRADSYMLKKNYTAAIKYYEDVIENEDDPGIKDIAKSDKLKAQKFIDEAKRQQKAGDIFYDYELYNRAEEKYKKAYEIYPYLDGIKKSINLAITMKEKTNNFTGKANYMLFSDKLKFNYTSDLPIKWGSIKVSSPYLAEFQNISFQKNKFFESENELKVSGVVYGKSEIADFLESEKGLFVFISAVIISESGEIKWEKDGYIKGDTPYLKEGEFKEFSLISPIIKPIESKDSLILIAYVKRNVIILTDPENPNNPDALKNIFSFYTEKGIKI